MDDFIWNVDSAEQVRSVTERVMSNQSEDLRRRAKEALELANRHEERANWLEANPHVYICTGYWFDHTTTTNGVTTTERRWRDRQERCSTRSAARREEMLRLRELVLALREAARKLDREAYELDRAKRELMQLFRDLQQQAHDTDNRHAGVFEDIKDRITYQLNKINELAERIGDISPAQQQAIDAMNTLGNIVKDPLGRMLFGFPPATACAGDPVNMSTGNFVYSKTDITIPGRYALEFTRFYNALDNASGVLGMGWTHNYNIKLHEGAKGKHITISFADGHIENFVLTSGNQYMSQDDCTSDLVRQEDGGWLLVTADFGGHNFNQQGQLTQISDMNGNATGLTYDAGGLLTEVYNAGGSLNFVYSEGETDSTSRLQTITDHTGRVVSFECKNNHLTKVTQPGGSAYVYTYDSNNRMETITNPMGITTLTNQFDAMGRTAKQVLPDGGTMEYKYGETTKTTTYVNQLGHKTKYRHDARYRTTGITYEDGSNESFAYDESNNRTGHTDRKGNRWQYTYDVRNRLTSSTNPLGHLTAVEYNEFNKPVSISLPNGGQVVNTFDNRGNLLSTTDPMGNKLDFGIDQNGKVVQIQLPDASTNKLEYDKHGNITSITDSQGNTTGYTYDELNQVVSTTNANGNTTHYTYTPTGEICTVTDALGFIRTYEYNLSGRVTKVTDGNNNSVQYKYNAVGKVAEITDPLGNTTKLAYDKAWNVTAVTDPLGNTVRYEYDSNNNISKTTDQEGHVTAYTHDPLGNLLSATNALGATTAFEYDALNRRTKIIEPTAEPECIEEDRPETTETSLAYDSMGNVTAVIDAFGNVTKREYDLNNRLIKHTDALGNATAVTYTALGKAETITNANGDTVTYDYYPGGLVKSVTLPNGQTETYTHDPNGNVVSITDHEGNVTKLEYDALNRTTKSTNALGYSRSYTYDHAGKTSSITDENGNTTYYKHNALGSLIEVTDANGHKTEYGYTAVQQLAELKQYNALGKPQITTYEHNSRGEVVTVTNPLGDVVRRTYDAVGNLTSKLDEDSHETLYAYNLVNQLTNIQYADGKAVELDYNALKQLTEMRDWLGHTTIEYDVLGRTTKTEDHNGYVTEYEYNALGQREKLTYEGGKEVTYSYTNVGRLETVTSREGATTYTHDALGRTKERHLPDGTITTYAFNPLGAITSLAHTAQDNTVLDSFNYSYDPAGNMTGIQKNRVGIELDLDAWSSSSPQGERPDNGLFGYTYDKLNRLTSATEPSGVQRQYTYDPLGNRASLTETSPANVHPTETLYNYNARNQLLQTTQTNGESRDVTNHEYDKRGNLISVTLNGELQHRYTFDATNMMVAAHSPTKGDVAYTYNGFNNRVGMRENDIYHNYVLDFTKRYDNLLMMQTVQPSQPNQPMQTQSYTWGNGLLTATTSSAMVGNTAVNNTDADNPHAEVMHYLQDHLGSPVRLTTVTNTSETYTMSYNEFGVTQHNTQNSPIQPFTFTGYMQDNISEMQYAQARYYDPQVGRFTAEDIVRHGINYYAYCNMSPLLYVDKNGLWPIPAVAAHHDHNTHRVAPDYSGGSGNENNASNSPFNVDSLFQDPAQFDRWQLDYQPYQPDRSELIDSLFQDPTQFYRWQLDYRLSNLRDVTEEVNVALQEIAAYAYSRRNTNITPGLHAHGMLFSSVAENMAWFYNQVNHNADWDIKRPRPWTDTIGTPFPGSFDTEILFRGEVTTPEALGNWTYGYIGAALGIPLNILFAGSWYADGFSLPWSDAFRNNELLDWDDIRAGFNAFDRGNYGCPE